MRFVWGAMGINGRRERLGALLLPGAAIWNAAPEKVLATRADWAETETVLLGRLIRAVRRAGRWLAEPSSRTLAAELLARPSNLGLPAEVIDRALSGRLVISPTGGERKVERFVEFHNDHANVPLRDQAEWIGRRLALRMGLDEKHAAQKARCVFRTDLYAHAVAQTASGLPEYLNADGDISEVIPPCLLPERFFNGAGFERLDGK